MFTFAVAKSRINNRKGFSLVELMVVVAIIGILAAIAVPSLNKYMAKARQSEAKMNLAGIYTAEKAFYAEYNTYASCFDGIGYQPEGVLRYRTGFQAQGVTVASAAEKTAANYTGACTATSFNTGAAAVCAAGRPCQEAAEAGNAVSTLDATSITAKDTFEAGASGAIFNSAKDGWIIDNNKALSNKTPGIL